MGNSEVAIIVGAGQGLSAALARLLVDEGAQVVLAARDVGKLSALVSETGARAVACDASDPDQVEALFSDVDAAEGAPSLVVFNPSQKPSGAKQTFIKFLALPSLTKWTVLVLISSLL